MPPRGTYNDDYPIRQIQALITVCPVSLPRVVWHVCDCISDDVGPVVGMSIEHMQRRQLIAEVAINLIAAEGLGAATIRRIAVEARFSTAAITHYFADKQELMHWAFAQLSQLGEASFTAVSESDPADEVAALLTMVAWCPENVRRWKAYLAFWEGAARDPELAVLIRESNEHGLALIERVIARRAPPGADTANASRMVSSFIQGMSLQFIVARNELDAQSVREDLSAVVRVALYTTMRAPAP
jgi:AcrR family transcriptional regulator